jgi:hypothetical protein
MKDPKEKKRYMGDMMCHLVGNIMTTELKVFDEGTR